MTTRDPLAGDELKDTEEVAAEQDPREAWLSVALSDMEGGAAIMARAARCGRPLPPREES